MNTPWKIKTLLFVYLLTTTIYLLPPNPLKNKIPLNIIRGYEVFFNQNWNLFGNTLTTNNLSVDYSCNGRVWKTFGNGELEEHKYSRFNGSGKMTYALSFISSGFLGQIYLSENLADETISELLTKNKMFTVFKKLVYINCADFVPPYKFKIVLGEQEKITHDNKKIEKIDIALYEGDI